MSLLGIARLPISQNGIRHPAGGGRFPEVKSEPRARGSSTLWWPTACCRLSPLATSPTRKSPTRHCCGQWSRCRVDPGGLEQIAAPPLGVDGGSPEVGAVQRPDSYLWLHERLVKTCARSQAHMRGSYGLDAVSSAVVSPGKMRDLEARRGPPGGRGHPAHEGGS